MERATFKAVGMQILWKMEKGNPSENQLTRLWVTFNPRIAEIPHIVPGRTYGLEQFPPGFKPGDPIPYTACAEVSEVGALPAGMTVVDVPASTYAVSPIREWLPKSKYTSTGGIEFEVYDHRFKGFDSMETEVDVFFPIHA